MPCYSKPTFGHTHLPQKNMRNNLSIARIAVSALLVLICNGALSQVRQQTMLQIQKLMAEKQARTPEERKISSQLLQAERAFRGVLMAKGVPLRPVNVHADASGNLEVDINAVVDGSLLDAIKSLGAGISFSSVQFHSIRARVNFTMLKTIAGLSGVKFIRPAEHPRLVGGSKPGVFPVGTDFKNNLPGNGGTARLTAAKDKTAALKRKLEKYLLALNTGSVNSQGDHAMGADSARAKYGYQGQGVRIAVLSDSYNALGTAATDIASGDLPGPGNPLGDTTPITVVKDYAGGTDEGRAMLQIVHDLAPKAQLYFATVESSEANFATNILALAGAPNNCDIIIDDAIYPTEPAFQDGPIAQAVNQVTNAGKLYFSSAGNQGSFLYGTSGTWEGDFNDQGSAPPPSLLSFFGTLHNFGTAAAPVSGNVIVNPANDYTLTWADPLGGATNDYDIFITDTSGNIVGGSLDIQDGTQDPYEEALALGTSPGDQVLVFKSSGSKAEAFSLHADLDDGAQSLTYFTPGVTHGHSSAVNAFCVAATPALAAYPGVFTSADKVEPYSSDGPRRIFYNADTTPVTPGNFLFATNGGLVRNKPDVTAADGVSTSMPTFASFYGTSAAAPHAGAVAALLKSANPSLNAAQIRSLLTSTALDIEATNYDFNSGFGIVQAYQAMKKLNPPPLASLAIGQVTLAEGTFSNHNGIIEPGESATAVAQLINASLVGVTGVTAVLATNTPGVTITQGTAVFGNITAGSNAYNTAMPFSFTVNSSVPCGTVINFYISASFSGGSASPQTFPVSAALGSRTINIANTLGAKALADSGYTAVSGQQTGRLARGATASSCASPLPPDTLLTNTGQRQFDAYTFTNTSGADKCVTVTVTSPNGLNIYTAAYDSSGFAPSNPAANFVADPGQSAFSMQYSFTAPAGKKYTIVVHDVNVTPASGSAYTLNVYYAACTANTACTPVKITSQIAKGAAGSNYRQLLTATGGSGNYAFSLTGNLPAGVAFGGDSLYGKPTQSGIFPLVLTANDLAGCPAGMQDDTLVIGNSTLAVGFGRVTATVANCTVQVAWQTLTGAAGETYTLQHSANGVNYTPLYTVGGQGSSATAQNYNYTHLTPAVGTNYYRVMETDADGSTTYSATAIVINTCNDAPVIAYPNPAHNTLTLVMPGTAKHAISVFDASGRLVVHYASFSGTLNIDVSRWATGVYTLSVTNGDKTKYALKVIKN
jgi:hypothetical protein